MATNIKETKLNKMIKASIKETAIIMPKYLESKVVLNKALGVQDTIAFDVLKNMIAVFSHDLDKKQANMYMQSLINMGMEETDYFNKRKIANSPVIKSIIIGKSSFQSVARELDKLGLKTLTSVDTYKKAHKIIDGKLKAKKDLPTNKVQSNKEKPIVKKDVSKMTIDEIHQNILAREIEIDLLKLELNKRKQESINVSDDKLKQLKTNFS